MKSELHTRGLGTWQLLSILMNPTMLGFVLGGHRKIKRDSRAVDDLVCGGTWRFYCEITGWVEKQGLGRERLGAWAPGQSVSHFEAHAMADCCKQASFNAESVQVWA